MRQALLMGRRAARVLKLLLVFTAIYNGAAVTLALAGLMQPWLAAIVMPLSSLFSISLVTLAFTRHEKAAVEGDVPTHATALAAPMFSDKGAA